MVTKEKRGNSFANKHVLLAVDDSDSSKNAVQYVASLLGGLPGFSVALVYSVPFSENDNEFIKIFGSFVFKLKK